MMFRLFSTAASGIALVTVMACGSSTAPIQLGMDPRYANDVQVRDCDGPALSLPSGLRAQLPARTGIMMPDEHWADLAEKGPGGFAGILLTQGKPTLMLVHPEQEAAAKAFLMADPSFGSFDIRGAQVVKARWDFAQLVDWYDYLNGTGIWQLGITMGDKNEAINRIRYGVLDEASRTALVAKLNALNVPCQLIQVGIESAVIAL
jgi:hypothetical protein